MYNLEIQNQDYSSYSITNKTESIHFTGPLLIIGLFHDTRVLINDDNIIIAIDDVIFPTNIAGELELYSNYSFKSNKKGVACYLFRPIDHRYPKCMVHSTIKRKYTENVYITVDYVNWGENDIFPSGNINLILGSIYDADAIQNTLIYKYKLCYKNDKCNFKDIPFKYDALINNITDREFIDGNIISIDPKGCRDIDDAFTLHNQGDHIVLDIHISDVFYLLTSLGIIHKIKRLSSIYLEGSIKHMLPDIISSNYGSLIENNIRVMISLKITMCCKTNKVLSTNLRKTYGKITKNYTYDNCPKYIDKFKNHMEHIYHNITGSSISITDSHKFIEAIMIIYNTEFCKYIVDKGGQPIYRIQEKNDPQNALHYHHNTNNNLDSFLNIIKSRCAEYSTTQSEHVSLQINTYTHATSPLRRIVDLMNQEMFYNTTSDLMSSIPLHIVNSFNTNLKKAYRDLHKLMLAHKVYNTQSYDTKCYIYDVDISHNKLYLYFPEEKLSIKTTIIHTKIGHIYEAYLETLGGCPNIVLYNNTENKTICLELLTLLEVVVNGKPNIYYPDKSITIQFGDICIE